MSNNYSSLYNDFCNLSAVDTYFISHLFPSVMTVIYT